MPRVFTPPARPLTDLTSRGDECITFARKVLGIDLMPWQEWLLTAALEVNPDGTFRFRTVILLVGRQSGKSTLMQIVALWRMYIDGVSLVIGTAQNLDVAEEVWRGAVDLAEGVDDLAAEIEAVDRSFGRKVLTLTGRRRYKVQSANRRGGRGLSSDLVLLDELREHQSWDAWGAVTKTTMARADAQIWCASNAGDASSVVLRYLRTQAHVALGNPDGLDVAGVPQPDDDDAEAVDSVGIFEWSAPPGCAVNDRAGWAQSTPALGHHIEERTIASAMRTDPEWVFRNEVLCQWNAGSAEGPFPAGAWEACLDPESVRAPDAVTTAGVDVSFDRSVAYISYAAKRADGLPFVRVMENLRVDQVADWLTGQFAAGIVSVIAGQGKGAPVSPLLDELEAAGLPVRRWEGPDLSAGTGQFFDLVKNHTLRHWDQPALDVAAGTAVPKITDSGAMFWNRARSPNDIAPLISANAAVWALLNTPAPTRSAYEDHDLIVV